MRKQGDGGGPASASPVSYAIGIGSTDRSTDTPTLFVLGPLFDSDLDMRAGPVDVPLELQIPSLKVNAPICSINKTNDLSGQAWFVVQLFAPTIEVTHYSDDPCVSPIVYKSSTIRSRQ